MWEIYLQQIREEKELYDEEINSGASKKEIYELVTTAKEKWNMEIPRKRKIASTCSKSSDVR